MPRRNHSHNGDLRGRKLRFETLEERVVLAGDLELVKDINVLSAGSNPAKFVDVGGTLYFTANTLQYGTELWKSDGTEAGTVLVKDVRPGASGIPYAGLNNVGGTLFFTANDGVSGYELWKSDGTETGTIRFKDIVPGAGSSNPSKITNVGGTFFFTASDGTGGHELWKTDGTEAGTVRVKDIYPGPSHSYPQKLTNVGGSLFFIANDGVSGHELWKSNGTEAGTVLVKDIGPGLAETFYAKFSGRNEFLAIGETLYFIANNGATGFELWRSNGTAAGTFQVKDIRAGSGSSNPDSLVDVGGTLYFGVNTNDLWRSDGTTAGTILVKDFATSEQNLRYLTNVSGTIFFSANDSVSGPEIWKSDGTIAGTVIVKNIVPGRYGSNPVVLTNGSGTLYFIASATAFNGSPELWKSDGTQSGTTTVRLAGNFPLANPNRLMVAGERLYMAGTRPQVGQELFSLVLNVAPPLPGDYNRDTLITPADHTFWAANFGATSGVGLQADGNNNGVVDAADYNVWRDNYTPPPAAVAVASSAVIAVDMTLLPQPSSSRSVAPRLLGGVARVAESPQRREALLIAAREAALVELQSSDSAPCVPLAHGSESDDTEQAARDGVFELLGRGGL